MSERRRATIVVLVLTLVAFVPGARAGQAPAGPTPEFPVDSLLSAIRLHSVFRGDVDWGAVEPAVRAEVAAARTGAEQAEPFVRLFERMNDVHSSFEVGGRRYGHYEGVDEATRARLLPLMARELEQNGKSAARLLDGRIGYVLVPGFQAYTPEQVDAATRELSAAVDGIARQKPVGWIVDLRLNGGGNLYPMLAGLRTLLGDGVVGGTTDVDGRSVQEWVLKRDGLYWRDGAGDRRFAEIDKGSSAPQVDLPVAVIVGPLTRSSGQATALAFRGRPRTILLGEPTARGYTTVIAPIAIRRDVNLSLAVGYMSDRLGTPHTTQVLPDTTVLGGDAFDALKEDAKVRAAVGWLDRQLRSRPD